MDRDSVKLYVLSMVHNTGYFTQYNENKHFFKLFTCAVNVHCPSKSRVKVFSPFGLIKNSYIDIQQPSFVNTLSETLIW